jgi:hypothetical protein
MSGLPKLMLTIGMVSILSTQAVGQGQTASGPGQVIGMIQSRLLDDPAVQKDLKLDEQQVEKAKALAAEIRENFQAVRPKLRGLPGDQAQAKMVELVTPINDAAMKSAKSFLKPQQIKRFHQIDVQVAGLMAMTYPVITEKLGISEEQGPKIRALIEEYQAESRKLVVAAGDDRQAALPKVQALRPALREECLARIVSLFTDDQKKLWHELTGEPFDVNLLLPPRR